jgi:argininosuccinate synthase
MFRTPQNSNQKNAYMISYRYYYDQPDDCGEGIRWEYQNGNPVTIEAGKSYRVSVYIKLNTPGVSHGSMLAPS